jgi:hypothetical protein
MKFRKLRIAWSVFWGLACLLLIVLWVRSYYCHDALWHVDLKGVGVGTASVAGTAYVSLGQFRFADASPGWHYTREAVSFKYQVFKLDMSDPTYTELSIPFWLPILASLTTSIAPWCRSRFSLRTLLIATTLVAVVLGLAVWAARK